MGTIRTSLAAGLLSFSTFCVKASRLLCLCMLGPDDLMRLTQRFYASEGHIRGCAQQQYIDSGLTDKERYFEQTYGTPGQRILVVGCSGGREAIALAHKGYAVVGIDCVSDCIEIAKENAAARGVDLTALVQDASGLTLPPEMKFDAVLLSALFYSLIPSRAQRLKTLQGLIPYLSPEAKILLSFLSRQPSPDPHLRIKKTLALRSWGNRSLEPGDTLRSGGQFCHFFDEPSLLEELKQSGYRLEELKTDDPSDSFAVLSYQPPDPAAE